MPGPTHQRFVLLLAAAVSSVGLADAVVSRAWDFASVFALSIVLQLVLIGRPRPSRESIPIRSDLARWLHHEAGARGEPVEELADRCLAAYRAQLTDIG